MLSRLASPRGHLVLLPFELSRLASMRATSPRIHAGYLAFHPGRAISFHPHASYLASSRIHAGYLILCGLPRLAPLRAISPCPDVSYLASPSFYAGYLASYPCGLPGFSPRVGHLASPHASYSVVGLPTPRTKRTTGGSARLTSMHAISPRFPASYSAGFPIPLTKESRAGGLGHEPLWVCSWTVPLAKRTRAGFFFQITYPANKRTKGGILLLDYLSRKEKNNGRDAVGLLLDCPADKKNLGGSTRFAPLRIISPRFHVGYLASNPRELSHLASSRATLPCFHASYLASPPCDLSHLSSHVSHLASQLSCLSGDRTT
ncbi:hypothetical protein ACLB2K_073376 [Fragaria x ananassa]